MYEYFLGVVNMTRFKRFAAALLSAFMILNFAGVTAFADVPFDGDAAAGNSSDDVRKVTVPARKLYLSGYSTVRLKIGGTYRIKYSLTPKNSDDYVVFKNYNKSVIHIDSDGLVTAVGYGEARVRLKTTSGEKCDVNFIVERDENEDSSQDESDGIGDIYDFGYIDEIIEIPDIEYIELADKIAMIRAGKKIQIEPILYPLGADGVLTYTSKNPSIASVSQSGMVTGVSDGTTTVTVTAENGAAAEFTVTVYSNVFRGIDVSKWQGDINWKKVYSSGVDFAIIRSSYGNEHVDEKLEANVAGCEKYGISYGFYHYTYATSVKEARKEARFFLKTIKKYKPDYPIVLDIENDHFKSMSRKKVTSIIIAFMTELENAGYYATVYSYAKFFRDHIDMSRIKQYDVWVASWGSEDKLNSFYDGPYGMWQYSAAGRVNGINGDVDLDYAFKDYSKKIRSKGLNRS